MAIKNKKGYFFTLTVILILSLVYLFFASQKDPGYSKQKQVEEQRLQEINRLITLIEKDAQTGLKIATFRTIMALDANVSQSGPIHHTNFEQITKELMINGTINNQEQEYTKNHSITDWENKSKKILTNLGLEVEFLNSNASINQTTHWLITSKYETTINVTDKFTKSNWKKTINITSNLPIQDFYDPLYSINTKTKRKIIKIPDEDSKNNLTKIIKNEYYLASNNSPSFLQRFQNPQTNLNYENIGIESLIDKTSPFIKIEQKPIIDSIYFTQINYQNCIAQGYLLAIGYNNTYEVNCQN